MKVKNIRNLPTAEEITEENSVLIARDGGIFRMLMRKFRDYIAYATGADVLGVPAPTAADAGKFPVVNAEGNGYRLKHVANTFLLWENSAPNVDFEAQSITCNTAGYSMIAVAFKFSTTVTDQETVVFPNDANTANLSIVAIAGNVVQTARRSVSSNSSGITFGEGKYSAYGGMTSATTSAAYAVPMAIYGIR